MTRRSGGRARVALAASMALGVSYPLGWALAPPASLALAWKGAPVALLALWAALKARERDGWLLAAVLALGALGDVLIELSIIAGGAAFAVGHVVAIRLYLGNRRDGLPPMHRVLALGFVLLVAEAAFLLPADRTAALGVALYAALLAAMAASAWSSRFPRALTGLGVSLFVASDLLIFARMGPLSGVSWANLAIWWLYCAGQFLIAVGVRQGLARRYSSSPPSSFVGT